MAVVVGDVELGSVALGGCPVGGNVGVAVGVGAHGGLIDEFAVLRDAGGVFGGSGGDGEGVLLAAGFLPCLAAVVGGGVADVMVCGYVPCFSPGPREVDCFRVGISVGLPVGVSLIFSVEELGLDAGPLLGGDLVAVYDEVSAS